MFRDPNNRTFISCVSDRRASPPMTDHNVSKSFTVASERDACDDRENERKKKPLRRWEPLRKESSFKKEESSTKNQDQDSVRGRKGMAYRLDSEIAKPDRSGRDVTSFHDLEALMMASFCQSFHPGTCATQAQGERQSPGSRLDHDSDVTKHFLSGDTFVPQPVIKLPVSAERGADKHKRVTERIKTVGNKSLTESPKTPPVPLKREGVVNREVAEGIKTFKGINVCDSLVGVDSKAKIQSAKKPPVPPKREGLVNREVPEGTKTIKGINVCDSLVGVDSKAKIQSAEKPPVPPEREGLVNREVPEGTKTIKGIKVGEFLERVNCESVAKPLKRTPIRPKREGLVIKVGNIKGSKKYHSPESVSYKSKIQSAIRRPVSPNKGLGGGPENKRATEETEIKERRNDKYGEAKMQEERKIQDEMGLQAEIKSGIQNGIPKGKDCPRENCFGNHRAMGVRERQVARHEDVTRKREDLRERGSPKERRWNVEKEYFRTTDGMKEETGFNKRRSQIEMEGLAYNERQVKSENRSLKKYEACEENDNTIKTKIVVPSGKLQHMPTKAANERQIRDVKLTESASSHTKDCAGKQPKEHTNKVSQIKKSVQNGKNMEVPEAKPASDQHVQGLEKVKGTCLQANGCAENIYQENLQVKKNCYNPKIKPTKDREQNRKGIKDVLLRINDGAENQLVKHREKISQTKKSLLDVKSDNLHVINALCDKHKELESQMEEFTKCIEKLKSSLALQSQTSQKDIDRTLLRVGIECGRLSAGLPMYARRSDLIKKIKSDQVSIILGETGSGKSTQLAQYLWEEGLAGNGQIVCTQPRKVAAITLANRVSTELVTNLGGLVGYKIGSTQKKSKDTKILFCTDHSLLNECLKDPQLSRYKCIIIDEAHERSIYTDILLGMIKSFLPQRPDLKLVITSATIKPDVFIRFFRTTEELKVSGRAFPVDVIYEDPKNSTPFEHYEKKAVDKAVEIHKRQEKGDILIFLTSSTEIARCCEELTRRLSGRTDFLCLPLHGQLLPEEQRKVFEPLEQGIRKIIFSTNCAETSITIDGIRFVVDTGVVNEMQYDSQKNMSSLGTRVISQSSADQRKGRAGRTSSGTCYRLYSEESFRLMKATNQPEILRIHLGQAVLKLAELGVDVRRYDFVESPDQAAIDSAIAVLQGLGALKENTTVITEAGRWLSKLPFDPRQSYLVYLGHEKNLLCDALTLTALTNNGSNMIYRGFNEAEEQAVARTRNIFGSFYGDLFMWFHIYKTWTKLPSNEQLRWCREKFINHKVLSVIKQTIWEVKAILLKELGLALELDYCDKKDSMNTLRQLVFEANLSSLCYFSGHKRAGYFAAANDQQVHIHPSSILVDQNHYPEWVIYTQRIKTSRDFIRGVTVVEESWIRQAIDSGKLGKNFLKVRDGKVEVVFHKEVGQSVFYQLVGPRFSKLRPLEQKLVESGMQTVFVEAKKDFGTFDVFSVSPMHPMEAERLQQEINEKVFELRQMVEELAVGQDKSGVRVVLKEGATVASVLMPDQSNKVCVSLADAVTSEGDVRSKFSRFGNIIQCIKFKEAKSWGFVKYASNQEARRAVDDTSDDPHLKGSLMLSASKLEAALTWCRRPIQGSGMAFIRCDPLERGSLANKIVTVAGKRLVIKVSKKDANDLILFNTGEALEDEIKLAIFETVEWSEEQKRQLQVQVLREKVELDPPEKLRMLKQKLINAFGELVPTDKFSIRLLQPKKGSPKYVGFICFDHAINGFQACQVLRGQNFFLEGHRVEINPQLKTSIIIPAAIMKVCEEKFYQMKKNFEENSTSRVSLKFRKLVRNAYSADIVASEKVPMVQIRTALLHELEGEIIDCCQAKREKVLLKKQGIEALHKIEAGIQGVAIMPCVRAEQIRLFGSDFSVNSAKGEIKEYLDKLPERIREEICLRDPTRPVGLMKVLMRQFPDLQKDFVKKFGVDDVFIDYKRHILSVVGSEASRAKVKENLCSIKTTLVEANSNRAVGSIMPKCVTCMSPMDDISELHRLESCGHSVCITCLRHQLAAQIEAKQFPVTCTEESCGCPWSWKDISTGLKMGGISEDKLVERALDVFVATSGDKFKFCPSPNCPVAYEVTENPEGCEFNCPSCHAQLCSSCNTAFHGGLTCREATLVTKDDRSLLAWRKQNPDKCKICPGCSNPVEKSGGCNKMHCKCGAYFCWLCLEKFDSGQDCYKHLKEIHGSFV
ncbi:ATP-dependent rna helicase deah11, chloroplastic [Elysia marginata]|uniref:ATP-dependent rna helicase deah11, chloroplastic n=1 Tax=Elysia marginata TaxID=1093978 RepID=A0AAV4FZT9_9GAST|nr:ATP-dependent rna helicase deah11, chloroplastic [Elysia marginata]